jgi:RNA polymerase sigma factor (sigma-70 family)
MSDRVAIWYEMYSAEILRYIRALTRNHPDAEDIHATVFLEAVRVADKLDDAPIGWFLKTAQWRVTDWRRARCRRSVAPLDEWCHADVVTTDDQVLDRMVVHAVWETTKLTAMQRHAFWQVYAEDRPIAEVAACVGLSHGAVKALLHRARVHLYQNPLLHAAPI